MSRSSSPSAVGWVYTAILFEPMPVGGWIALALLAWLGLCAWAAITFLGSTVTGSAAAAAGLGFLALLVLSIASAIPNVGRFRRAAWPGRRSRWRPGRRSRPATSLTAGRSRRVVLIARARLGAAAWSFRRQEL